MNKTPFEELKDKCWDYVFFTLSSEDAPQAIKEDIVKKMFKVQPGIERVIVNFNYKGTQYRKEFTIIHERNEYPELKTWRMEVFKRDGFKCVKCGSKIKIQAHHRNRWSEYPAERFDLNNGETLCIICHRKTENYGRKKSLTL